MEGSVIDKGETRKGHAWHLRVFVGRDGDGKRKYVSQTFYGTRKQAEKELRRLLGEKDGLSVVTNETFANYYERWLDVYSTTVRPSTFRVVKSYAKNYFIPLLGNKKMTKINTLDIQGVVNHMIKAGVSSVSISNSVAILGAAFRQAVEWGMVVKSPVQGVKLPKLVKAAVMPFTQEEVKQILDVSRFDHYGIFYRFAVETGCRPGEILALQWSDVDYERRVVRITKTLSYVDGKMYVNPTKTKSGVRSIPLSSRLVTDLKRLYVKTTDRDGYVFVNEGGKPINGGVLERKFKKILEKAKLPTTHRLYDLRHTCATLLLLGGEHPKIVSERLGHASVSITLDTYSHVLPTMQEQATSTLERMLD